MTEGLVAPGLAHTRVPGPGDAPASSSTLAFVVVRVGLHPLGFCAAQLLQQRLALRSET
jgi:hypothetical protein